ncbi:MAG: pyruvate kinase, partial [Pseudomonadota bacterium]
KLRCGVFASGGEDLEIGGTFRFDLDDTPGDINRVQLPHPEIFEALEPGATLLVNDGKIRLTVTECSKEHATTEVIVGGRISDRKGINVPDVVLPLAALSEKDKKDLEFVCRLGVDWLGLSFVQRAGDVEEARELANGRAALMSKIEKPAAVDAFEEILAASDGIMVARGDLGVELPINSLPPIQKRMVRACRRVGKPVIVATQMMESMISSPVPTRAEVSDVAQAIYEGADAVMLSAESAAGDYPVEAVTMMDSVARSVEEDAIHRQVLEASRTPSRTSVADAITAAAREVAETTDVTAIACFTHSGTTALLMSREKPLVPIIALTPLTQTARRLTLAWGLHCVVSPEVERFKMAVVNAVRAARENGFGGDDDKIIVTAGVPFNTSGSTNILRVAPLQEKLIFDGGPD